MKSRIGTTLTAAGLGATVALTGSQLVHASTNSANAYKACMSQTRQLFAANAGQCAQGQTAVTWFDALSSSNASDLSASISAHQDIVATIKSKLKADTDDVHRLAAKYDTLNSRLSHATTTGKKISALNEIEDLQAMQLQMLADQRAKFIQTLSNLLKKLSNTDDAIVQNMK